MNEKSVVVIGAGIVGICIAIELQRRGYQVQLLDRSAPAQETSFGNAGVFCHSGIHPLAEPSRLREAPRLLSNLDSRLLYRYRHLPGLIPWMLKFGLNCNAKTFTRCSDQVASISVDALQRHAPLMSITGTSDLLQKTGWLKLFRSSKSFAAARELEPSLARHKIPFQVLDSNEIKSLEPHIQRQYAGGHWMSGAHSLSDPGKLCQAYFDLALKQGALFKQQLVRQIHPDEKGWTTVCDDGNYRSTHVVIALGAWSNNLIKELSRPLPFIHERGYHMMFAAPAEKTLSRSIVDVDRGYVMTPMTAGIRVTSASNPVAEEAPPDYRQITRLLPEIQGTFAVGEPLLDQPWMGRRAATPDSLPIIGPIPNQKNLLVATGHCHLGLTLAPVTAELIADEIRDQPNPLCRPFYPSRF